ncbi:uncharacterized protein LOC100572770 isoform X1 [Acyrthosiphon pisum]|uniref:Uncharacterized protein n=2 Tax=Acyrthosiphon pisum TaxID=7029 RepID=A0A8R2JSJ6_ACYPI|nr:uncharacterized protein LOC100572770 isoform X1 [Acyrthosiphon pisum]
MSKINRTFNIKVNRFNLHDIFEVFGSMCSMIQERTPEAFESKTLIEKLQYLLDSDHTSTKEDKSVETKLDMVDKCVGNTVHTKDQGTHISINIEANKSISEELLEIPLITEINSNDVSKTKEIDTFNKETTITDEKNSGTFSSPCLSSMTQLINNNARTTYSKIDDKQSPIFQINKQMCSTPGKKDETKINIEPMLQCSPKNIHNLISVNQAEHQQIPEATPLDSMPGFSKEDKIKDGSVIIDTGELVDTFLNDQSLLEKIADTINKCFEAQKELESVLDPPTLEKALDSAQSDPQIKNILDEFLVFNVDNTEIGKKACTNDHLDSIKSRLRSAKKKEDASNKLKKNNFNMPKNIVFDNEECMKVDNNIVLIHEGNIRTSTFDNYDLLSNQIVLQSNDLYSFNSTKIEAGEEDYLSKANYVKIAPKITPMLKIHQVPEKHIFPKRRKHPLEVPGIQSKFRRTNIISRQPVQIPKSIIIEVPNQSSFESQEKNHIEINKIIKLPEVSSKINDTIVHNTPDDRLEPPKNKSMSTPRRRSTHVRCLEFSTPQPKNMTQNQARSVLLYGTPKRIEKCLEEPSSSPLPILQADWGSVNGFESIIKKESIKHWDTDIREMVGAGILTSDADGRKTRKKKMPRKKIKPVINQVLLEEQKISSNPSITINELYTDVSNISENTSGGLIERDSNKPTPIGQQPIKEQTELPISSETFNNFKELHDKQSPIKSDSLNSLKNVSKFPISLETSDKITKLNNEQVPTISGTSIKVNNKNLLKKQEDFLILLETPDKTTESYTEEQLVKSDTLINNNNETLLKKENEFINSLKTSNKISEFNNKQLPIISDSSKSQSLTQINLEQSYANINKQNDNQNQLIESSYLKTVPNKTDHEKDPNISKSFNNYNYSLTVNNSKESTKNVKEQDLLYQTDTNNSSELNSSTKSISIEPIKPNLVDEISYKCDDAAVDIPKTPISKIIYEYNLSKPCSQEHYDNSLTETSSIQVFRETYLNKTPISLFPSTPGNSRSVDTIIVPPEQNYVESSNNTHCKIINKTKKDKVECTPFKSKEKLLSKSKIKNTYKKKSVGAKQKQGYESVKVELFGSEISSSSSSLELLNTNEQLNTIVIKKKPQDEEKNSGFKHIPKSKSIKSTSIVNVDDIENNISNELHAPNMQPIKTPSIKPTIVKPEKNNENTSETIKKKSAKKFMVHFDDPVEKCFSLSKSPTPCKSNNKNAGQIQKDTTNDDNSEQLIGLSRYLNKRSSTIYDYSPKKKTIKTIKPRVKITKINNGDSKINSSKKYNVDGSSKNISTSDFSNKRNTLDTSNQIIKLSENCIIDVNKGSYAMENNAAHNKSIVPLGSVQTCTDQIRSMDDNISTPNLNSNKKIDISLDRSELPVVNYKSSVSNISCVTVRHDDTFDVRIKKICDTLDNIEYLKQSRVFDIISEDGLREEVYLNLSETFTFLDILSESNNVQLSDPITSQLITTNKTLDVIPKMESGELRNDEEITIPVTSTPKNCVEIKNDKDNRARRSPSFWEDSVHNYPIRHRDDRHRETNRWQNKTYHNYDRKYRPNKYRYHNERLQFDSRNHFQRSYHQNVKREFWEDSVRDKDKFKHKDEKRRNYRDYSKGNNWLEENERFSIPQRMSLNDLQKSHRSEDIVKKATKKPSDREINNKTPVKVSKVEHQRLLTNVDVDDFLSVVHGKKNKNII